VENGTELQQQIQDDLKELLKQFDSLLEQHLPDLTLLDVLKEGLSATKVISAMVVAPDGEGMKDANSMTRDFVEVPDFMARHKYLDTAFRIKNRYPAEKKDIGVTLHDFEVFDMPAIRPPEEVTAD
jgi:hypothetical protein